MLAWVFLVVPSEFYSEPGTVAVPNLKQQALRAGARLNILLARILRAWARLNILLARI